MLECSGHLWSVKDVRWLTMDVGAEVCEPQQVWGDAHYWLMENFASKCQLDLSIWTVGQIKNHWWKKQRHYFADQGPCNQSYGFSSSHVRIREVNGTPLQYSCLENPMDRGAWRAAVHGVAKGWTRLSDWTEPTAVNCALDSTLEAEEGTVLSSKRPQSTEGCRSIVRMQWAKW